MRIKSDLLENGERLLATLIKSLVPWQSLGLATKSRATQLASDLRAYAIDLSYNKATEYSPEIQRSYLLSAKLILLASGPNGADLHEFEKPIFYYRTLDPNFVAEYEMFKGKYA